MRTGKKKKKKKKMQISTLVCMNNIINRPSPVNVKFYIYGINVILHLQTACEHDDALSLYRGNNNSLIYCIKSCVAYSAEKHRKQ